MPTDQAVAEGVLKGTGKMDVYVCWRFLATVMGEKGSAVLCRVSSRLWIVPKAAPRRTVHCAGIGFLFACPLVLP